MQRRLGLGAGVVALCWLVGCHMDALLHPTAATNPPEIRLAFTPPPNGTVHQPLAPAVQVSAVDTAGHVDTTFTLDVTITLDANPGRATLAGTRTVAAAKGVATFADLSLDQADTGYTFLATAPGLRGVPSPSFAIAAGPPTTGGLTITTATTGAGQPSGYTVTVDGGAQKNIGATDSVTYAGLSASSHTVALGGVPANCTVSGGVSQSVAVTAGDTARASFTITCSALTGSLTVTSTTTGSSLPTSDYTVTVDGGTSQQVHPNGNVTFSGLSVGSHTVTLTGVPSSCTVSGGSSQSVSVTATGGQASFSITCSATTGNLTVTTATSGPNQPSGYTFSVDGGSSQTIGPSTSVTVPGLGAGAHSVRLSGVPSNCSVSESNPQSVTVPAGGSATARFTITCAATTASLAVTTTTTGSSLPTSDYSVSVDGGTGQAIHPNGSVTFNGLSVGSHTVTLSGVPSTCTVSGGSSQSVNVTASGGQASFTITCAIVPPPTGSIAITTSTTGLSLDPDGYTVSVSGAGSKAIGINQTVPVTFTGVSTGAQTVTLSGVAANCSVTSTGGTSQTVTVVANQTVTAAFTISCTALPGTLTVTTATSGSGQPSGYTFSVDGGAAQAIAPSASVPLTGVSAGSHTVQLNGVPANCSVTGGPSQSVTIPPGGSATASFTVTCTAPNQPPTAAFTFSCNGLTCSFTDQSTDADGSVASWSWSFGDGGSATQQNPSHTYSAGGSYTVTLTVKDNQNASSSPVSHTVQVTAPPPPNQPPTAAFTFSCNGLTCSFTDQSTDPDGSVANWSWSFGDNQTATQQSPSHTYSAGGSYTVTLTVKDNQNASSSPVSHTVTVTAPPPPNQPPTAAFAFSCNGLTCSFTDQSTDPDGSVASWSWSFGDNQTATQQSPSHTYSAGGSYTVTLTVKDNQNASSSPVSHTVQVTAPPPPNQPPTAAFTFSCNGLTCSFTDQSTDPDGSVASWSWSFGDGGTATQQNPSHTYAAGGSYTVTLTVKDNQNASSGPVSHTVQVTAPPPPNQPPTAAFAFSCDGLTCSFTDQSTDPDGSVASWSWSFGDGGTATQQNPSHTYTAGGSYMVTLTVKDNQNASSSPVSHTVTVTAPPPPNQPPVVTAGGDQSVLIGALFNLSGASFSDPDHNGPWTVSIDWGDGSSPTTFTAAEGAISASHTYSTVLPATYTLTVTVTDAGGLSGSASKTVKVGTL